MVSTRGRPAAAGPMCGLQRRSRFWVRPSLRARLPPTSATRKDGLIPPLAGHARRSAPEPYADSHTPGADLQAVPDWRHIRRVGDFPTFKEGLVTNFMPTSFAMPHLARPPALPGRAAPNRAPAYWSRGRRPTPAASWILATPPVSDRPARNAARAPGTQLCATLGLVRRVARVLSASRMASIAVVGNPPPEQLGPVALGQAPPSATDPARPPLPGLPGSAVLVSRHILSSFHRGHHRRPRKRNSRYENPLAMRVSTQKAKPRGRTKSVSWTISAMPQRSARRTWVR
jgi:hypothetical protein